MEIKTLEQKKEVELEVRDVPAVCSRCGKKTVYKLNDDIFTPTGCPFCKSAVVNVYPSERTGVLTAWVK